MDVWLDVKNVCKGRGSEMNGVKGAEIGAGWESDGVMRGAGICEAIGGKGR